jgi:glycosyltransferase involved in cell wall biosynthesis
MFAYNSEATIVATLESLLSQSLISVETDRFRIEIIVVPNGCTDRTVELTQSVLNSAAHRLPRNVTARVRSLPQPGKCNAWNRFVHEFANQQADYVILMDSDITFLNHDVLENLVDALRRNPKAQVATDTPIKDIARQPKRGWREWLSMCISNMSRRMQKHSICGQLYCGRGETLRTIWLPTSLPVEDGFLRAMILTNGFQSDEDYDRIVRAENASHEFAAHVHSDRLLRHEEWLIASSTVNSFIYDLLWKKCRKIRNAGLVIRDLNESNPNWFAELIDRKINTTWFWVVPSAFVFRRFRQLFANPLPVVLTRLPVTLLAFMVDCIICVRVNHNLKAQKGVVYWRSNLAAHDVPPSPTSSAGAAALEGSSVAAAAKLPATASNSLLFSGNSVSMNPIPVGTAVSPGDNR